MNITIFIGGISGGGAERVACNLANYLVDRHHVILLTMSEVHDAYGLDSRVKLVSLLKKKERKNKIVDNFHRYCRLQRFVCDTPTDVFIVMLPVTICLLLHFRKKIRGKIIASERNNPNANSFIIKKLLSLYGKRADAWVFQTEEAAKWYAGIARKSVIIPNAINPSFIRTPYCGEREKTIIAVGRLSEQKNFVLLIDAFARIANEIPDYRLEIYGKGPLEKSLRRRVKKNRIEDRVYFNGYVANIIEKMEKSSLFVLSSDYEGMPNALMEAMVLGVPCISTDCPSGGPRQLIDNGYNGILVPTRDVSALTEAIKKILLDPELSRSLGINARDILSKYNPQTIYSGWEALIKEVAAEK